MVQLGHQVAAFIISIRKVESKLTDAHGRLRAIKTKAEHLRDELKRVKVDREEDKKKVEADLAAEKERRRAAQAEILEVEKRMER